jgi:hypothetical protein
MRVMQKTSVPSPTGIYSGDRTHTPTLEPAGTAIIFFISKKAHLKMRSVAVKKKQTRGGRGITLFKPEYTEDVEKLAKLGVTEKDLALYFDVDLTTIQNWKKRHPDFFAAMLRGKQKSDSRVAAALFNNAIGYHYTEEQPIKMKREVLDKDGKVIKIEEYVQVVKVEKYSKPETLAQIFHLKNRRPDLWRDVHKTQEDELKLNVNVKTYIGDDVITALKQSGHVMLEGEYEVVKGASSG